MAVKARYKPLGESRQLGAAFTSVFIDRPYVDLDYRSDLAWPAPPRFSPAGGAAID